MPIPILNRQRETPRHCATCAHFNSSCDGMDHSPRPFCGATGESLLKYVSRLEYTFCANWDRYGDAQAQGVFMELTELVL